LDLGTIIIHLMTSKSRSFFELERLWSAAPVIFGAHSSKSS
jgi:ribosome-associated protein